MYTIEYWRNRQKEHYKTLSLLDKIKWNCRKFKSRFLVWKEKHFERFEGDLPLN